MKRKQKIPNPPFPYSTPTTHHTRSRRSDLPFCLTVGNPKALVRKRRRNPIKILKEKIEDSPSLLSILSNFAKKAPLSLLSSPISLLSNHLTYPSSPHSRYQTRLLEQINHILLNPPQANNILPPTHGPVGGTQRTPPPPSNRKPRFNFASFEPKFPKTDSEINRAFVRVRPDTHSQSFGAPFTPERHQHTHPNRSFQIVQTGERSSFPPFTERPLIRGQLETVVEQTHNVRDILPGNIPGGATLSVIPPTQPPPSHGTPMPIKAKVSKLLWAHRHLPNLPESFLKRTRLQHDSLLELCQTSPVLPINKENQLRPPNRQPKRGNHSPRHHRNQQGNRQPVPHRALRQLPTTVTNEISTSGNLQELTILLRNLKIKAILLTE